MKQSQAFTWGILSSLAIHVTICLVAWFYVIPERPTDRPPGAGGGAAAVSPRVDNVSGGGPAKAAPSPRRADDPLPDIKGIMDRQARETASLSPQEQAKALRERTDSLNKIPEASVDKVAAIVEKVKGVDRFREYAPKAGVKGDFDIGTAVLHDINKRTRDGKVVYEFTMVDKDGRSLSCDVDEKEMSADDLQSYNVFQIAKQNKSLRRLVDAAIKIRDAQERAKEKSSPAADHP